MHRDAVRMETLNEVARSAEAQQAPILTNYAPTRAAEVVIEVPDDVVNGAANEPINLSNYALPNTARPTVPLLSQVWVSAPQQRNRFNNAVPGGSNTSLWIYVVLLLVTIATVIVGRFVYNHLLGIFLALVMCTTANFSAKLLDVMKRSRSAGQELSGCYLIAIYIAGGLGLFFINMFVPFSLISNCLLLTPSIEPLELLNVLYTVTVVINFVHLSSNVVLSTVVALPLFRRSRVLHIAIVSDAATQVYILLVEFACGMTYLMSFDWLIVKYIIIPMCVYSNFCVFISNVCVFLMALASVCVGRLSTFGSSVSHSVAEEAGGTCAVCYESYRRPVKLNVCSHVFCEECIKLWLLRQNTCPLCRRPVYVAKPEEAV